MKLKLLFTLPLLLCIFGIKSYSQTVLWSENFNSPSSNQITINSGDVVNGTTCVTNSTFNAWTINDAYKGGTDSAYSAVCGAEIAGTLPGTPNEVTGITGANAGDTFHTRYIHIYTPLLYTGGTLHLSCASWNYAGFGLFGLNCPPAENYFSKMNSGVSTVGKSGTKFKFWWACGGVTTYGQIYYSTDGGNTWTQAGSNFTNQTTWKKDSISNPAFDGVADLRFGFLWVSPYIGFSFSGNDPSFSLDDLSIEVPGAASPTISTGNISGSPFCNANNVNVSVPYTINNPPLSGTFTVYLSDASGNFSPGTVIGSGTSSPISATIPSGTTAGTGYKIKVENGSTPSTASASFTITASVAASVTINTPTTTICQGSSPTFTATPGNGIASPTYQWYVNGNPINGATSTTYTSSTLADGDVVTCQLSSTSGCVTGSPATSNNETMTVTGTINGGTITTSKDTICTGTVAHLTVSGYTTNGLIQWQSSPTNSNFTNVASNGNAPTYASGVINQSIYYRVEISSGTCTGFSNTLQISVLPAPRASFHFTLSNHDATFNSDSTTGATSYNWDFGDGHTSTTPDPTHTYDTVGILHVCLEVSNNSNCNFNVCKNITIFPLGVNNITGNDNWNIYPDPFTNQLLIATTIAPSSIKNIEIYDVVGRLAFFQDLNGSKLSPLQIDVADLKSGIYFLKINAGNTSYVKSIIKQ